MIKIITDSSAPDDAHFYIPYDSHTPMLFHTLFKKMGVVVFHGEMD